MRIARIARPVALYGATVSSKTFETIDGEIDFDEVADVSIPNVIDTESYSHMPRLEDSDRKFPKDANRVNLVK